MTRDLGKELGKVDNEGEVKDKRRVRSTYATDTDVQRLRELKPFLMSEWETSNGVGITDSEAIRRVIFELWKIKVAKLRDAPNAER